MSETILGETGVRMPPTQAELPYDDGIPMESQRHQVQLELLINSLLPWLEEQPEGYVGGNMFVYFSLAQVRDRDFRGPDFFAVLGVPKGERRSWVVWEEGKGPDLVIELLSETTAKRDKNEKKLIYQNQLRVPEYFWFDPFNPEDFVGFSIRNGAYEPLPLNDRTQSVTTRLGLALQKWQGIYKGIDTTWLRWATLEGELLLTFEEQERQRAEQERQRANQIEFQLQQTVRNLLQEGMSTEQVARLTSLSIAQVEQLRNS